MKNNHLLTTFAISILAGTSQSCYAGWTNGVSVNGVHLNGIYENGITRNGTHSNGFVISKMYDRTDGKLPRRFLPDCGF